MCGVCFACVEQRIPENISEWVETSESSKCDGIFEFWVCNGIRYFVSIVGGFVCVCMSVVCVYVWKDIKWIKNNLKV